MWWLCRVVTADMELSEALKIVQDVTSHDYFMDLSGKLNDFLSHVSEDEHTSLAIEHMMVSYPCIMSTLYIALLLYIQHATVDDSMLLLVFVVQ